MVKSLKAICFRIFAFMASILVSDHGAVADDAVALYDLVRAAQSKNGDNDAYKQGQIAFAVEYQPPEHPKYGAFRPVEIRGRVMWSDDDALWIYKAKDPDKFVHSEHLRTSLENSPTRYLMINNKDNYYAYNIHYNKLFIKKVKGSSTVDFLLDVMPASNWFMCCAPEHKGGRPWIEMIGPSSPVMKPNDSISIIRDGSLIRQTRMLSNGAVSTTSFSLDWDGNVVQHNFVPGGRNPEIRSCVYEWDRSPAGVCVLRRCVSQQFKAGSDKETNYKYDLKIESIDLKKKIRSSDLSLPALLSLLPRDVYINDQITHKGYYPNKNLRISTNKLDTAAEVIAREGFLAREPPK